MLLMIEQGKGWGTFNVTQPNEFKDLKIPCPEVPSHRISDIQWCTPGDLPSPWY